MPALIAILAVALAHALRRLRVPGWAALGGAIAGILLGPGVLGRAAPELHERTVIGGFEERRALDDLRHRHALERASALRLGMEAPESSALGQRHAQELAPFDAAWRDACWRDRQAARLLAAACALAVLVAGGAAAEAWPRSRDQATAALHLGAWAAAVPGVVAIGVLARTGWGLAEAAIAGAAVAVGPLALLPGERALAVEVEPDGARVAGAAARVSTILALLVVGAAVAHAESRAPTGSTVAWPWMLPLLAAPFGRPMRVPPAVASGILGVALPAAVALAFVRIEPFIDAAWLPMLLLVVLAGDGRWIGAALGGLLPGSRPARSAMRLAVVSGSAGSAQAVFAATALHAALLDPVLAYPLLVGAVLAECAAPLRRRAFRAMD